VRLTADLRMFRHSGIGRYLRNIFAASVAVARSRPRPRVLGPHGIFT
jgi:hypothetical protein